MPEDIYGLKDEGDDEFQKMIKSLFGKGDSEKENKYRFMNKSYLDQLNKPVSQNVIIKIINKGSGKAHLDFLLKYVARDLESQKGEDKSIIYDEYGEELSREKFKEFVNNWSEDFDEWELKTTPYQDYKNYKDHIKDKYKDLGMSEHEWRNKQLKWDREFYSYKASLVDKEQFRRNLEKQKIEAKEIDSIVNINNYLRARVNAGEIWHDAKLRKIDISEHEQHEEFKELQIERAQAVNKIVNNYEDHYKHVIHNKIKLEALAADHLVANNQISRNDAINQAESYVFDRLNPDEIKDENRELSKELIKKINSSKVSTEKPVLEIYKNFENAKFIELGISQEKWDEVRNKWNKESRSKIKDVSDLSRRGITHFDILKGHLENKYYDKGLDSAEGKMLISAKAYSSEFKVKNEFYDGAYVYDKKLDKFGFIIKTDDKNSELLSLGKEGKIERNELIKEDLIGIGKEMKAAENSKPKDFSHIVLSTGGDNPDKKAAFEATKEFLDANFNSRGFEYKFTMHEDSKHLHFHVILNNKPKKITNDLGHENERFSVNKFDLQALRADYTKKLDEYGINRTAVLQKDRKGYLENLAKKQANQENFDKNWYDFQMKQSDNKSFDALKFRKNAMKQLDGLSDQLFKQGHTKLGLKIMEQKEEYKNIKAENIQKTVSNTVAIIEKEEKQLAESVKTNLSKRLGKPSEYQRDIELTEEVVNNYKEHLEKTLEDINDLPDKKLSPIMVGQKAIAEEYIEKRINEVDRFKGEEKGLGIERKKD